MAPKAFCSQHMVIGLQIFGYPPTTSSKGLWCGFDDFVNLKVANTRWENVPLKGKTTFKKFFKKSSNGPQRKCILPNQQY